MSVILLPPGAGTGDDYPGDIDDFPDTPPSDTCIPCIINAAIDAFMNKIGGAIFLGILVGILATVFVAAEIISAPALLLIAGIALLGQVGYIMYQWHGWTDEKRGTAIGEFLAGLVGGVIGGNVGGMIGNEITAAVSTTAAIIQGFGGGGLQMAGVSGGAGTSGGVVVAGTTAVGTGVGGAVGAGGGVMMTGGGDGGGGPGPKPPTDREKAIRKAKEIRDKAADGTIKRGKDYHGKLDPAREQEILSNPDEVYLSDGKSGRLIFRKGEDVVIVESKGSAGGNVVTSYGPSGPRGESGAAIFGGKPTDPGLPVTDADIVGGNVKTPGGDTLPPAQPLHLK